MVKKNVNTSGFTLPKARAAAPRSQVEEQAEEAFADAETPNPKKKEKKPANKRRRREMAGERISPYLPSEVVEELLVTCARQRISQSQAVTEAVKMWLEAR